jgi:hypothetical protein
MMMEFPLSLECVIQISIMLLKIHPMKLICLLFYSPFRINKFFCFYSLSPDNPFPESGYSIGISTHHDVLDGKSSTMFIKAWAYRCNKTIEIKEPPTLLLELQPLFDRNIIKDPDELGDKFSNNWRSLPRCSQMKNETKDA